MVLIEKAYVKQTESGNTVIQYFEIYNTKYMSTRYIVNIDF